MTASDDDSTAEEFSALAAQCEAFAAAQPQAYRRRVVWLAVFGYLFPPLVLLSLVALFSGLVWLYAGAGLRGGTWVLAKVAIALVVLVAMVIRAMWPRFEEPDGIRLRRADAPMLFDFIDEIRARAGNPKVHRVYLTDDLNAAVAQTPRLGLFGWYRNNLIVGLPLLQALTKQEFAAVVAHEFGHLSGAHGKMGAWIYRSRLLMARILHAIEAKRYFGSWIFHRFYRWYEPYFAAYSFALAREQEYEADRMAATATSRQAIVDALVRVSVAAHYIGGIFWAGIWKGVYDQATPAADTYGQLGHALNSLNSWDGSPGSFEAALDRATDYTDTHPSLSDRAKAVGVAPRLPPVADELALCLLPMGGERLVEAFSTQWQGDVAENWKGSFDALAEQRQELAGLDSAADSGALSEEDALHRGFLAGRFMGPEAALERFEQASAWSNGADRATFAVGRVLLELGRDEGLTYLDRVMDKDGDAIVPGCELAEAHLRETGRDAEAEAYERRRVAQEELLNTDWMERHRIAPDDILVLHNCAADKVEDLVCGIEGFRKKGLKRAWLLRKVTEHRQHEPAYFVICTIGAYRRWTEDMDDLQGEMANCLSGHDDVELLVCDVSDAWLRDKAMAVPAAQIYPRR